MEIVLTYFSLENKLPKIIVLTNKIAQFQNSRDPSNFLGVESSDKIYEGVRKQAALEYIHNS